MKQNNIKKKKFIAYFDEMENFHFSKDVGMLPYCFAKKFDLDLEYITSKENVFEFFLGYKVTKIKSSKSWKYNFHFYFFLLKNIGKIDYLMVFFAHSHNFVLALYYKILNPKGKMYIKMDLTYVDRYEKIQEKFLENPKLVIRNFRNKIYYKLSKFVDMFSVEQKEFYELFLKDENLILNIKNKIAHIPNGVSQVFS
ncbi:MAG: hypothetical protein ACRC0V_10815, partial [Fusobacteriaceae bacterium]